VSGVLPVLLGAGTRCSRVAMQSGKEYICYVRLHGDVSEKELEWALSRFIGPIYQVPPVRSSVARRPRQRTIYELEVLEREGRDLLLRIACSGGTYIRKISHDIGILLGKGAHMQELRRTRAGPATENDSYPLIDIYVASWLWRNEGDETEMRRVIRPVEELMADVPKVEILDSAVDAVCHGAPLAAPGIAKIDDGIERGSMVAVFTLKGELVCLGRALRSTDEIIREGGLAVKTERVVMERGTYPSSWKGRRGKPQKVEG